MADLSLINGSDVVLSTFFYNSALLKSNNMRSHTAYERGIAEHRAITAEIAREKGLLLVDLASSFPAEDESLFVGPMHLNKEGNAIKARIFADAIIASGIIERRVRGKAARPGLQ